ncbi:GDSL-type esterase/lipase family protein [Nocardioides zeae]|uniref:GDSL-type esterase/lipase family protein n=1 Tax=Nocardioides imazamoxiresistens TaxID=3231893 RepID=A0ABU3PQT3_9ACTN|nr:GDSL-type esterase/lipase family protein [Nocardioides zeae]MDT9591572.1 GDSL-type esterase/lipase family protein [Nocardioides zeae]
MGSKFVVRAVNRWRGALLGGVVGAVVTVALTLTSLTATEASGDDGGRASGQVDAVQGPDATTRTPDAPQTPAAPEPTRIALLGDSVTQGSAGDVTWRYRLARHLRDSGTAFDFVGVRDDLYDVVTEEHGSHAYANADFDLDHTARWGMRLDRLDVPVRQLVAQTTPDVLVEMLGINDLRAGVKPAVSVETVRTLVADARAASPRVDVVLVELPQVWVPGVSRFNAGLATLATELSTPAARVVVADATLGFTPEHTWDGLHPDVNGEQIIARGVATALHELGVGPAPAAKITPRPVGPRTPVTVTDVTRTPGGVRLTWTRPAGATAFEVTVRDDLTGATRTSTVTSTTTSVSGQRSGRTYTYDIRPVRGADAGADSTVATVSAAPGLATPAQPATRTSGQRAQGNAYAGLDLAAVPGASAYVVRTAPSASCTTPPAPEAYQRYGTFATPSANIIGTSAAVWVTVAAQDATGTSEPSAPVCVAIP